MGGWGIGDGGEKSWGLRGWHGGGKWGRARLWNLTSRFKGSFTYLAAVGADW